MSLPVGMQEKTTCLMRARFFSCATDRSHILSLRILTIVSTTLAFKGLLLKIGTVVDASGIAAPNSTKDRDGLCDPVLRQAKKVNR